MVKKMHENKKVMRNVQLNADQILDFRYALYQQFVNPNVSEDSSLHNGFNHNGNNLKKRSFNETGFQAEENEIIKESKVNKNEN